MYQVYRRRQLSSKIFLHSLMARRLSAEESVENTRRRVIKQVKQLEKNKDAEREGVEGHDDAGRRRVV